MNESQFDPTLQDWRGTAPLNNLARSLLMNRLLIGCLLLLFGLTGLAIADDANTQQIGMVTGSGPALYSFGNDIAGVAKPSVGYPG